MICGKAGKPCCRKGRKCIAGLTCKSNRCRKAVVCGKAGKPCCRKGRKCTAGLTCKSNRCRKAVVCGKSGQRCCPGRSRCGRGLVCSKNSCRRCGRPKDLCCANRRCNQPYKCVGGQCLKACGGERMSCCPGQRKCNGSLTCRSGRCLARCGGKSQPCCSGKRKCDAGLSCDKERKCRKECGAPGKECCRGTRCHPGCRCYNRRCCKLPKNSVKSKFERMISGIVKDTPQIRCPKDRGGQILCEPQRLAVLSLINSYRAAFDVAHRRACANGWKPGMRAYRTQAQRMKAAMDALKRCSDAARCCKRNGRYLTCGQPLDVMGTGAIGYVTNDAAMSGGSITFDLWAGTGMESPF